MNKYTLIEKSIEENNGYLFSSDVEKMGISRTSIANYIRKNSMERVAKGVYITTDSWEDNLYIMQKKYSDIIFSGETALYLHQMIDREYSAISVCVPRGFSGSRLREKGVVIHQESPDEYGLGVTEVTTNMGNIVRAYNRERCICELVRNRKEYEVQMFQTAIKEYMGSRSKDLSLLSKYAEKLRIHDEIMKYVEVLA